MKKEKKESKREIMESTAARGPCPECGTLALNVWKGGGFNMSSSPSQGSSQDTFIKSLQQQIKILELEVVYLKKQLSGEVPKDDSKPAAVEMKAETDEEKNDKETIKKLKTEIQAGMIKMEEFRIEKNKLEVRIRTIEQYREEEKHKYIDKISKLTGRVEYLETENKSKEEQIGTMTQDLEKHMIISKDREKKILQLMEELEASKQEVESANKKVEQATVELSTKQNSIQQLQDKFLGSSQHILQETLRNMEVEMRSCKQLIKQMEIEKEDWTQTKERMETLKVRLTEENSELRAEISRIKAELDSEVRIREGRETITSLESQELNQSRERENNLKSELSRIQTQLEKQVDRVKELQERLTGEGHLVTSQELRIATQKSRIAELEGMISLAGEQTNNIRRQNLTHIEKEEQLRKDIETGEREISHLTTRLAQTESSLLQSQKQVDELMQQQRERWDQFCRMADSMKNLSSDMIERGQANKNINNRIEYR